MTNPFDRLEGEVARAATHVDDRHPGFQFREFEDTLDERCVARCGLDIVDARHPTVFVDQEADRLLEIHAWELSTQGEDLTASRTLSPTSLPRRLKRSPGPLDRRGGAAPPPGSRRRMAAQPPRRC